MKQIKLLGILLLFTGALSFAACGGNKHDHNHDAMHGDQTETTVGEDGPEYTSAYVCQMHCEGSGSDKAGKCPVCGMDYVINENHSDDEHAEDEHDH